MSRRNFSIVHWFPNLEKHRCGYCKQTNSNCSYGMWAECLTVEDYQYLIDRGWRRSGKYCYKPVMDTTCCPLYTIRCETLNFKSSKSQKKIIKRVNRYLSESVEGKPEDQFDPMVAEETVADIITREKPIKDFDLDKIETDHLNLLNRCDDALSTENSTATNNDVFQPEESSKMSTSTTSVNAKEYKKGKGADPSKPPCKKAKLIRLERKQQKLSAKGIAASTKNCSSSTPGKTLEELIDDISESPAHKLRVCLVRTGGNAREWHRIRSQEYPVYKMYQMKIHGDPPEKCTESQFTGFLFESPLQIELKRMHSKDPSFKENAKLFTKYQMYVHNEQSHECDVSTYKEFLVDTPLKHLESSTGPPSGYGSFHQQYWLDDKLIAVGVIDILPKCVSSVYFFYDPDYRHLTLGTYGSLRELYFVRELHRTVPDIKYYYMGYYIHSCPKMRYKANLSASYLLCPETYMWFSVENCVQKLDKEKYSRLNDDIDAVDSDGCNSLSDIDDLMILIGYKGCVPYKFYKEKVSGQEEDFYRLGSLIGKQCIRRLLIVSRSADF